MNVFTFDKPEVQLESNYIETSSALEIGEEVNFVFPEEEKESLGIVERIREDDETGEDLYDVRRKETEKEKQMKIRNKDTTEPLLCKWIPRIKLKKAVAGGDAAKLERMEAQWRNAIRRQKQMDIRKEPTR